MRTQSICLALAIVLLCPFAPAQWVHTNLPDSDAVSCFAVSGTNLFAGTDWGVFLSTNNGASWTAVNEGFLKYPYNNTTRYAAVNCFAISGASLFAGAKGVFLSTDNGTNWTAVSEGLPKGGKPYSYAPIDCIALSGTNLFAAWEPHGMGPVGRIFLSTNAGASWIPADSGLTIYGANALAVSGANVFAGVGNWGGVIRSSDNGASWTPVNEGLPKAVYDTTDYASINCFAVSGANLFAGTYGGAGVFLSTNNGASWTPVNEGLPRDVYDYASINCFAVSGTNLFAGTSRGGVWRRPLSEMIVTSVSTTGDNLPSTYSLAQNYPNPFNPSTTINYGLPHKSSVSLAVYNTLGQRVALLVLGDQEAGYHEVRFDASGLSSGVYFYRLQAGDFVATKKLILLK
jgi:hypothetical protein